MKVIYEGGIVQKKTMIKGKTLLSKDYLTYNSVLLTAKNDVILLVG